MDINYCTVLYCTVKQIRPGQEAAEININKNNANK